MSPRTPTAAALRRARARYDAGEPLGEIARDLRVTDATFRRWRVEANWPARPARPSKSDSAPRDKNPPALASLDTPQVLDAVRRAVQGELLRLTADETAPAGSEARSRALASLTRTLGILLRTLETQVAAASLDQRDNDDTPPVDLADLRNELARRLHKLSAERDDP